MSGSAPERNESGDEAAPDSAARGVESFAPKRRRWSWAVVVVLLGAAAAWAFILLDGRTSATKVLIAVDLEGYWWEGSQASAAVTDRFNERLEALGLTPVKGGDPKIMEVLERAESPREAAKRLGAAFVVSAVFEPQLIEHDVKPKYYESRVEGDVFLSYEADPPQNLGRISGWSGSRDPDNTKVLLGEAVADKVFDRGIVAIMEHRAVREVLASGTAVERGELTKATRFLAVRNTAIEGAEARYRELLENRLAEEEAVGHDQRYHGALDEQVVLAGISERGFLAQATKIQPFYDPKSESLRYYRDLDSLYWSTGSGERTVLTQAYNLFGYPAASPDGNTVVFVEDIFGWAKAIAVSQGGAAPKRVRVDPDHRYSSTAVSPDGRYAALYDRPCRKCLNGVLVVELQTGKTLFARREKDGEPSGFVWLGPNRLLLLWQPVPAGEEDEVPPQGIYSIDLAQPIVELQPLLQLDSTTKLDHGSVDRAGKLVAFKRSHIDGRQLAIFDLESKQLIPHDVGGGLGIPSISPDGRAVVFEQSGEIVHLSLNSGLKTQLTRNRARDRYPSFSPDGSRIYYESLARDPNFPRRRSVSVIVSVAAPKPRRDAKSAGGTAPPSKKNDATPSDITVKSPASPP
jgi:hypothetical protein